MQSKRKLCIVILALLLAFVCVPACADTGGYVVRPLAPDEIGDYQNMGEEISFWELPLWVQAFYASGTIASLVVLLKILPFFLIRSKKMLDNINRDNIYRYIEENPGCTVNDISRGQSMNVGSVRYHVNRLDLASKIVQMKAGKFTRLFRNSGAYTEREKIVISAVNIKTNKSIVLLIKDNPGMSNKQIADQLDIKESMAHTYLSHLLRDRIVRYEKNGQNKLYYLESEAEEILQRLDGKQLGHGYSTTV